MTTIKRHKELLKQSIEIIEDMIAKGLMSNTRAIGFNTSAGAVDLLSIYLHKLGKISISKIIEHQWFKKPFKEQKKEPLYERKLRVDFPRKEEVYALMCEIEERRTILAYGNPTSKDVESVINSFWKLKKLIEKEIGEEL